EDEVAARCGIAGVEVEGTGLGERSRDAGCAAAAAEGEPVVGEVLDLVRAGSAEGDAAQAKGAGEGDVGHAVGTIGGAAAGRPVLGAVAGEGHHAGPGEG